MLPTTLYVTKWAFCCERKVTRMGIDSPVMLARYGLGVFSFIMSKTALYE